MPILAEDASACPFEFGAEGIGLFRIEHMFYGKKLRKTAVRSSQNDSLFDGQTERRLAALDELFPFMKKDIKATMECDERDCPSRSV